MTRGAPLPIDAVLGDIVEAARARRAVVVEAPPGAGKTTRVPAALDDAGCIDGEIWVIEPRRLAARMAARRVAAERGEAVGKRVGYRVRFDEAVSRDTRVVFVTDGILLRRLQADPALAGVGAVVFDEFHERRLATDLALALVERAAGARDLVRVVMSATLEAEPVARYLGDAPRVRSEGRRFDVALEHLAQPLESDRRLELEVTAAVRRLLADGLDGDVLVFLPGAAEIRRAHGALADVARHAGLDLATLHGDLSPDEQDRAVTPGPRRKVILSTNVAESSVTVEGVVAVIDSGLHRLMVHSPWSGLPSLTVQRISRASAAQRAGRAGRLRPGRCLRLYTKHDHDLRPAHDLPEVRRADLAEAVLLLGALGASDPTAFPWFEAPLPAAVEAATRLLERLGARAPDGTPTARGRRMLELPLHPRQARLVLEGAERGVLDAAVGVAALLGEGGVRKRGAGLPGRGRGGGGGRGHLVGAADAFEELALLDEASRGGLRPDRAESLGLDAGAAFAVDRARKELLRTVGGPRAAARTPRRADAPGLSAADETALGLALLAAYPDRVARRRRAGADELVLSGGGTARLSPRSVVGDAELVVAVDAQAGAGGQVMVTSACAIEPEWLLEVAPEALAETSGYEWNETLRRADHVRRTTYDQLVLEERRQPAAAAPPTDDAGRAALGRVVLEAARAHGLHRLIDPETLVQLRTRVEFANAHGAGLPPLDDAAVEEEVARLAGDGATRLEELGEALLPSLLARLGSRRLLDELAPERVTLPGGRSVKVEYPPGQPPFIASRLQDFFGLAETPKLGRARVPLTLHLLGPHQRPLQVTADLASFWSRHYPALRRELSRRYPRHSWPEDPLTAAPPAPRR